MHNYKEIQECESGTKSLDSVVPINDAFGNNLDKAVRKFQESAGLEVDGSLGADSVYALFNYKTFS